MIAPIVLIVGLALAGGGFDVSSRHIAGLGAWLVVVALLVLGAASASTLARPFYWTVGLIGGLAFLSALSTFWSGSIELSVIEADRILVYLSFFLAAFLIAQTSERRQRFAEGLAIAVTLVALLGLASRLLPHLLDVSNALGTGPRLRYPLGYWNANGAAAGIAIAMLLWMSRHAAWRSLRWLSVAAMPAVLLALYFTYSRGGLLALVVGAVCLLVLSRDRLWLLGTLAAAAAGVVPAILAVQDRHDLAENLASQAAVNQGVTVLAILLAGIVLTVLGVAALRRLEAAEGRMTGRALRLSRNSTLLRGIAAAAVLGAIALVVVVGGHAWEQFSKPDLYFPRNPAQHFGESGGAGRHDFWRVAIDAFGENPILGHGAGTYLFSWDQLRSITLPVHDAHSLYLEAFAELGAVGGLMVLALVGTLLWCAFSAWRAAPHPERERHAALLAAMLAFAIGAAFDWFWEIAGLGAVFFLAAGVMVSVRCAQLAPSQAVPAKQASGRRYGLAVAGLGVAWIAAIALVGPLLVDREIKSSQSAAAAGDYSTAVSHADSARSIEPWAASPYVQLGLLAELQGDYPTAIANYGSAIDREEENWQWYYLRSKAEHAAGSEAAARRDIEHARRLNPQAKCLREGWNCG
ncbi:MAG TPA: O-antigen ligase family protein [Solirubrobacterales bacterium]|nr:O-antigen ligase family protein [Solirubrobacterales bacterium]